MGDIDSPEVQGAIEDLQAALASDGLFGPSQVRSDEAGNHGARVTPRSMPIPKSRLRRRRSTACVTTTFRTRSTDVDAEVLVGGDTAFNKDFFDLTDTYTPIVFIFVLGSVVPPA